MDLGRHRRRHFDFAKAGQTESKGGRLLFANLNQPTFLSACCRYVNCRSTQSVDEATMLCVALRGCRAESTTQWPLKWTVYCLHTVHEHKAKCNCPLLSLLKLNPSRKLKSYVPGGTKNREPISNSTFNLSRDWIKSPFFLNARFHKK
jgi:hypothetical protein